MEENPNIDNYQDEGIDILALVKQLWAGRIAPSFSWCWVLWPRSR